MFYENKMNQLSCISKYIFNIPMWYNSDIKIGGQTVLLNVVFEWWYNNWRFFEWKLNYIVKTRFCWKVPPPFIPPMQYNSNICAISKYMSFLSVDRSSLIKRDYSPFLPFYFDSILLKDKVTKSVFDV